MKQFRKVLALTLALVLSLSFAACASKSAAENVEKVPAEEAASDTVEQKGTITVAASPTPHAEILEQAKPILQAMGWTLGGQGIPGLRAAEQRRRERRV